MDPGILGAYRDGYLNVLFVGGMKPNKGHALALRTYAAYRHLYTKRARMIFVGNYDKGLSSYLDYIRRLAYQLGVDSDTVFAHSVSPAQLKTFYYAADVFLCVSEHEGFCVPLIEAMSFRVPILAWGQTAVGETMGKAGIVHDKFEPLVFADSLEAYRRNPQRRLEMADEGRLRYEMEFHPEAIQKKLVSLVREVEISPHA
jgi:glycosyltransferase involved in cell wall biosynthesis